MIPFTNWHNHLITRESNYFNKEGRHGKAGLLSLAISFLRESGLTVLLKIEILFSML